MKSRNLLLLVAAAISLTGCDIFSQSDSSESLDFGDEGSTSEFSFFPTQSDNGSDAINTLGSRENGVTLSFEYSTYVDATLSNKFEVSISQHENLKWGKIHTVSIDGEEEDSLIGMALLTTGQDLEYYYLEQEQNAYVYYGTVQNPEVDFSFEKLEKYLTLQPTYFAAFAVLSAKPTIEVIAGQQCATFVIPGSAYGDYSTGSQFVVSYSMKTRLLMRFEVTTSETDEFGLPVFYQQSVLIKTLSDAETMPTLVK